MVIPFEKGYQSLKEGKPALIKLERCIVEVSGIKHELPKTSYQTEREITYVTKVIKSDWLTEGHPIILKVVDYYTKKFTSVSDITFIDRKYLASLSKIEALKKNKKPTNKRSNYVGVEMEMCTKLTDMELTQLLIKHKLDRFCTIAGDGSINTTDDHQYDLELKVLAKESEIEKVITKVCKLLNTDDRATTNDSCGLHVHLDMRNRDVSQAYSKLYHAQDEMETYVDDSRLDNDYCYRNTMSDFSKYANNTNRYKAINTTAYKKFKTLEVRLHDGTLSSTRINKWIKFLVKTIKKKSVTKKVSKRKAS